MCFRIAVRAIEAWLMADREKLAHFLSVSVSKIPLNPEITQNPKTFLVNLAKSSRRREIREDMVPRDESGRRVGPAYTSRMIEFIESSKNAWRPDIAAMHADSLSRALRYLKLMIRRMSGG